MSFDGIRPTQLQAYADPLSAYNAANQAAAAARNRPNIKSVKNSKYVDGVHKELDQYHDEDDRHEGQHFSEEELEQILIFAKLRGIMNLALESNVIYTFTHNETTNMIDLVAGDTSLVVLTLTIDEMAELMEKLARYAGMMADRQA